MCLEGRCIDPRVVWFIYIHSPASQKRSDLWDSGVMYGTKRLLLAIGALTLLERAGFMNCACQCLRPSAASGCYRAQRADPPAIGTGDEGASESPIPGKSGMGTGERERRRPRANRGASPGRSLFVLE